MIFGELAYVFKNFPLILFLTFDCDRKLVLRYDPSAEYRKLAFLSDRIALNWCKHDNPGHLATKYTYHGRFSEFGFFKFWPAQNPEKV